MKKNYTRLCSLALALCMSAATWAIDIVDGVYQIGSADDMLEFANALLENNGQVDAVMTADIDMSDYPEFMLSTTEIPLLGTFDGQYHTLNVYQEQPGVGYVAPIRKLGGSAVLKNLIVTGTLIATGQHCGGLIGSIVDTGVVVENCVSKVDIITHVSGDGSHGGLLGGIGNSCAATISSSAFAGSIKSPDLVTSQCGGICGWSEADLVLNNVLLIAEFELMDNDNGTWGSLTFVRNPTMAKLNNCYYLNPLTVVDADAKQITEEQIASGEACFLLNGSTSADPKWFQNLAGDVDPTPVPNATHGIVYLNGRLHCDGSPYEGESIFTNINAENVRDDHEYEDGVCTACFNVDPEYMTAGEDGFYNIATAGELRWFAFLVNSGQTEVNARLTEAIDLDGVEIPSIGNKNKMFAGVFDGQLKPVSNISVPFFGQAKNATLKNIALESGEIFGRNRDVCEQTGTLAGRADNTTITNSYSKASIYLGDEGDCGGLVGKMKGTIQHCYFAGTCSSAGWSHAGIVGSNEGTLEISDCFVAGALTSTGGDAKGTILGWSGGSASIHDCISIEFAGFNVGSGHLEGSQSNCVSMSAEQFEAGAATWWLNGESFAAPTWFQAIEEDEHPMLEEERGVVLKISDELFTNDISVFKAGVVEEGEAYVMDLVAYAGDITAFSEALETFKNAADMEQLIATYADLSAKRKALDASAAAYVKYQNRIYEIIEEVVKAGTMVGPAYETLSDYLEKEVAPGEQFPNGSSDYILANMNLDVEGIEAEILFANNLLDVALKANYKKGDDITGLVVNPDFTLEPRWTGWEATKVGSTLTTGNALAEEGGDQLSVTTTGEFWNATGEVKQSITGLKNGIYEVRANAATRPANNAFDANDNYIAYLFANKEEVYVQALTEDMVDDNTAIDGVNCHLTGNATDHYLDIDDVTYYVPYGPVSAAFAFSGGRYENRVLAKVTDGKLTIGVRLSGSGVQHDWMGFGNFRLRFLGEESEAADLMGEGLDNYIARANNLIKYRGSNLPPVSGTDGISYKSMPNFSNALRTQLQACIEDVAATVTAEDKMAVCARFTELFHQIEACKAAYVAYLEFSDMMYNIISNDESASEEEFGELADAYDDVYGKCYKGEFSLEEAAGMALIKNTAYYQRYMAEAPEYKDGAYQLKTVEDLAWLVRQTNEIGVKLNVEMAAPIDMTEVAHTPIGSVEKPFVGTFKGNFHAITGLSQMLFGTVDGATIDGVNIQGGAVKGDAAYAGQTGTLAGCVESGTFTRCFSSATVSAGAVGDCGGLIGKVKRNFVMKNCMFAGNLMSGWSAGGLIGSTHYDYNNEPITISDVLVDTRNITYKNGDGHGVLVGWMHANTHNALSNAWVIAGSDLTDLNKGDGNKDYVKAHTTVVTAEQAATGMVAWGLNRGEEKSPVWFQKLGDGEDADAVPTLIPSDSKIVLLVDGEYVNAVDPTAVEEVKEDLNNEPQIVNVYDLNGRLLLRGVDSKTGLRSLPNGLYIIGGRKVLK